MFALNAIAFSALKPMALALAIVNAVVIAGVLVCLFVTWRMDRAEHTETPKKTFFDKTE